MPKVPNDEVVTIIMEATQKGTVQWKETSSSNSFVALFPGGWSALISKSGGSTWVSLLDALDNVMARATNNEDWRIDDLYDSARRQALNIDERLANFLDQLKKQE